jgi:hypothetical protein
VQHLIRVQLLARTAMGSRRTWSGAAWVDPDDPVRSVRLDVDRDFVRHLGLSHTLTIYLTPRTSARDTGPDVKED